MFGTWWDVEEDRDRNGAVRLMSASVREEHLDRRMTVAQGTDSRTLSRGQVEVETARVGRDGWCSRLET